MSHLEESLGFDCTRKQYMRSAKKRDSRRLSFAPDLVASSEETIPVLEEFIGVQWKVYRCSPLWDFPFKDINSRETGHNLDVGESSNMMRILNSSEKVYDTKALKRYARVIAGYVSTHAVDGQDNPYKVEFGIMRGVRGNRSDNEALKITVSSHMETLEKRIFTGILCGVQVGELQLRADNVINIPVFLTSGNVDTTERVIYGLEKCFDCVIGNLLIPDLELRWMSAMWAGLEVVESVDETNIGENRERRPLKEKTNNEPGQNSKFPRNGKSKPKAEKKSIGENDIVKLVFGLPEEIPEEIQKKIRNITVSFPGKQLKKIWDRIHKSEEHEFTEEEMTNFHDLLRNHIHLNFGLKVEKLQLIQIALPFLTAHTSGIIRIENINHVKVVLRYLTELCQGDMLQADPTLSCSVQYDKTMEWGD